MVRAERDRGYAWVIVATLSFTETVSWGILYYGFAVFLAPMERELGWSRATLTGAFSLALLVSGLAAPLVGRLLDRIGPRLPMALGSAVAALLLLVWAQVGRVLEFYAVWAGLGLAMALVLYEPAFATLAKWFEQRRRQAITVLTLVGGLASVVFTPLNSWLVERFGWRSGLLLLAAGLAVGTALPHALVLRAPPAVPGARSVAPGTAARTALRSLVFWALTAALTLAAFVTVTVNVHLLPSLLDRGFAPSFAATATGLVGLMQIPGRLLVAPLGRWFSDRVLTTGVFLLQGGALLVLLLAGQRQAGVLAFVALFGMANGMITIVRAARPAELFGSAAYGAIAGTLTLPVTLARAAAPLGAGALYTLFGGYEPVWWGLVVLGAVSAGAAAVAESAARRESRPPGSAEAEQRFALERPPSDPEHDSRERPEHRAGHEGQSPVQQDQSRGLGDQEADDGERDQAGELGDLLHAADARGDQDDHPEPEQGDRR